MAVISLGPFDLQARVAKGGMGEIWRGEHRAQHVPVAVKVMIGEHVTDARFYAEFRREVQAAARLAHPHVAMVFDYGAIPSSASSASDGALVADSPYLVMEWAAGGSLDQSDAPLSWGQLSGVLLTLLDALGHAHARGIVHRDLKPANVLLAEGDTLERAIRLSDFGIARSQPREHEVGAGGDAAGSVEAPMGTPYYMAPEQFSGAFRDFGPWTDLYALGIMTWQLVSGRVPFDATNLAELTWKHLGVPLPPLEPRREVPPGLDGWVRRLAAKDPRERFRNTADAAWALGALAAPAPRRAPRTSGRAQGAKLELAVDGDTDQLPPQPAHWSAPAQEPPSMRLVGAGLGLWSLRSVPLVDRTGERDALWEALRTVRLERAPRVVVLRGAAGCGKSRVAQWLVERAHETGAAETIATSHQAVPDRRHGVARLVDRRYRTEGLSVDDTLARLEVQLRAEGVGDPHEWRALAAIVHAGETRLSLVPGPDERLAVITRMIARAAAERPCIVWLDDVQWGEESLSVVRHVLGAAALPVLFVLTARDEALAERPRERELLGAISAMPGVRSLRVGPLARSDVRELVEQTLGLSAELAREVEARVGGHPLFAMQIVGDWVNRGLLEVGAQGFVLRRGARTGVPDDLHGLWMGRVEGALAGRPSRSRLLVQLAAVLGAEVDAEEFALACQALGEPFPADLLEPLILHRLVVPDQNGWSFVHGLLRESLVRAAAESGQVEALHRACASMLAARTDRPPAPERLAHHLLGAGELERSLAPLVEAARARLERSEIGPALSLLATHDTTLRRIGGGATDPRAIDASLVRAEAHRAGWDFEAAEREAQRALAGATDVQHRERGEAMMTLAHTARQRGEPAAAMERARRAFELFDRAGDARGRARTLLAMAILTRQQGDLDGALQLYETAASVSATLADVAGWASAVLGIGNVHRTAQRLDQAKAAYERARAASEPLGHLGNVAHCVNGLAELARFEGKLEEAEAGYREVLRLYAAIGSKASFIPRMNLGLVLLGRRDFAGARRELEQAAAELGRGTQRGYLGSCRALLLPCAAAGSDGPAFDEHLTAARALLAETATVDPDIAAAAELAAQLWETAGDPFRRDQALDLARAQWTALGDPRADALAVPLRTR